ncbi:MAG: hypothetical protein M0C28_00785 [Candidatus Moduliflexus flocculans]|nr:hypothetical protein [Candidatus Moduliflexus flocculans]
MTVTGTVEAPELGLTSPFILYQKEPDKMRMDITIVEAATDHHPGLRRPRRAGARTTMSAGSVEADARARVPGHRPTRPWATRPSSAPQSLGHHLRPEAQGDARGQGLHRPRADAGRRPQGPVLPRSRDPSPLQDSRPRTLGPSGRRGRGRDLSLRLPGVLRARSSTLLPDPARRQGGPAR